MYDKDKLKKEYDSEVPPFYKGRVRVVTIPTRYGLYILSQKENHQLIVVNKYTNFLY